MPIFVTVLIGYLLGGINPSYIIARIRGFDIRKKGSGNAGASNAVITMGKAVGVFIALFDIAKAIFAVWLAGTLFPDLGCAQALSGTACILGHIFPVTMGFRGGKGLACLGGVLIAYDLQVFLIMLAIELVLVLVADYICIVPITASVVFPIVNFALTGDPITTAIYCTTTVVILIKHIENIRRIRLGTEIHFSFLWKKDSELERVGIADE